MRLPMAFLVAAYLQVDCLRGYTRPPGGCYLRRLRTTVLHTHELRPTATSRATMASMQRDRHHSSFMR